MTDRPSLEVEFARAEVRVSWGHAQRLLAAGVPATALWRPTLVGVLDGTLVVPAGWADWEEDAPGWAEIRDMVQIDPEKPETWQPVYGTCPVLGLEQVEHAVVYGHALQLHRHPLDWIRARGSGACIIDWSCDPRRWIGQAPAITCATPGLARQLQNRMEECARWHRPRITVAQSWRAAA
ncbi:hypothetical protein UAJ10_09255 [Nitrospirillum sp. BR 11164]|uniref:hypothetical protein n=1 Tax=Nitrospirillum sp. BR 11164 TaxID=3104324 RepID=UPI002AFF17C1|nr:hypothetical protein [Nitrospirillum sp. BR 11164]MEA1649204.1 hypothetical protein [Nitrospirillum sp. BR 11164]